MGVMPDSIYASSGSMPDSVLTLDVVASITM
jgi:hypothetical protein